MKPSGTYVEPLTAHLDAANSVPTFKRKIEKNSASKCPVAPQTIPTSHPSLQANKQDA